MRKLLSSALESGEEFFELMTHPGYNSDELRKISSLTIQRENELKLLTSSELRDFLQKKNIILVDYSGKIKK